MPLPLDLRIATVGLLLVLGSVILGRVTERKHDHVMSGAAELLAYGTAVKSAPTR